MPTPPPPSEPRVYITQLLCPDRHCIFALAFVAGGTAEEILAAMAANHDAVRATFKEAVDRNVLNPKCELCQAEAAKFTCETGRTDYASLPEAVPQLRAMEAENLKGRRQFMARRQAAKN